LNPRWTLDLVVAGPATCTCHLHRSVMITQLSRNTSNHIDMHYPASSTTTWVTWPWSLTSASMHAEVLPRSIHVCVPSLVSIAQVVFFSEHGHIKTHKHSHRCNWLPYSRSGYHQRGNWLSHRDGQHDALSVEVLSPAAQLCTKSHLKRWLALKVTQCRRKWQLISHNISLPTNFTATVQQIHN